MRYRRSTKIKNNHHYWKQFPVKESIAAYPKKLLDEEDIIKLQKISLTVDEILYHKKDIDYNKVSEFLTSLGTIKKKHVPENLQNMNIFINTSKKVEKNFGKSSDVKDTSNNFKPKRKRQMTEENSMFTLHFNKTPEDNFNSLSPEDTYNVNDLDSTQISRRELNNDKNMRKESEINEIDFDLEISKNNQSNNTKTYFIEKNKTQNNFQYNKSLPIEDNITNFKQTIVDQLLVFKDTATYDRKFIASQQRDITISYKSLFQKRDTNMKVPKKDIKKSEKSKISEQLYQEVENFVNQRKIDKYWNN